MGARVKPKGYGGRAKYADISHQLRMAIVEGRFPPGARLPVRSELERMFGASRLTIQRSMDRLLQESFIVARGRLGTFVSDSPPHLGRYGLVFPCSPADSQHWAQGASVFFQAGSVAARTLNRVVQPFYCSDTPTGLEQAKALVLMAERRMLSGVIVYYLEPLRLKSLGLDQLTLPTVHIHHAGQATLSLRGEHWTHGEFEYCGLITRSIEFFIKRGRRRIALICLEGVPPDFVRHFNETVVAQGLETHAYWQHAGNVDPKHHGWVRNSSELLFRNARASRPDAVLILDENLTEPASQGIQAAGAVIGADCDVVAQCSFPSAKTPPPGVVRIGFDMSRLVADCMQAIGRKAKGERVETLSAKAVFEDEISSW